MKIKHTILSLCAALCASAAMAVPAKPGLIAVEQPDGSFVTVRLIGDEHFHFYMTRDSTLLAFGADGFFTYADADLRPTGVRSARLADLRVKPRASRKNSPRRVPQNMLTTTFPSTGSPRTLVVLVDFPDKKFSMADPVAHFQRLLSDPDFDDNGAVGSALDYFTTSSMGKLTPQFDVYGPVTLSQSYSYYGKNDPYTDEDMYAHRMPIEACQALDDEIDFTVYDTDNNGEIDNVYVFYAGYGEANGGSASTVWPHSWDLSESGEEPVYLDGVLLNHYATSNELYRDNYKDYFEGIGTFCHEFSHVLGLPDLYHTASSYATYTPGCWTILDHGSYNADGHVPPVYSSFERLSMGWITPTVVTGPADITLNSIESNEAILIATDVDNEFFLFENRQPVDYDQYLPGHGMLIWHIDYDEDKWYKNRVNNTASHQNVDVVEADGTPSNNYYGRPGATFPGTRGKRSFTASTTPAFKSWSGYDPGLPITEIAENSLGQITFKVAGGASAGIGSVGADATEWLRVSGHTVASIDGTPLSIYSLDGRLVAHASESALTPGAYIIARGEHRTKIVL